MDVSAYFRGRKITIMGLGLLGRGVGDAKYLAGCGAELIVTDLKSKEDLTSSLKELEQFSNITYVLGEHRLEDFRERDMLLKAAGVPLNSPHIAEAKKHGIPVRMSADLFAELSGIPIVGITGTRGKSTVTHMIHHLLSKSGKKTVLGGNIRGMSTLALLPQIQGDEIAVLELDSWQLQGFGEIKKSPHVAVFTTFFPDHLNYYKSDMDAYLADKAHIFLHQHPGDTFVLGAQAAPKINNAYAGRFPVDPIIPDALPSDWKLGVPGEHNRYNAALARATARALGVSDVNVKNALESFAGVPGRLECVREVGGVRIYNDTTATTPEAAIAALRALDEEGGKRIVLIAGGADKSLDMKELVAEIRKRTKRIILLAGSGTNAILGQLPDASVYDSLKGAFEEAMRCARPGDFVLLSPAFASFGMFKNEFDRGDQFNALVKSL